MFVITPPNALGEFVALWIVVKQTVRRDGQCDESGEYEIVKTSNHLGEANLTPEAQATGE